MPDIHERVFGIPVCPAVLYIIQSHMFLSRGLSVAKSEGLRSVGFGDGSFRIIQV